jgi:hypothetical protein
MGYQGGVFSIGIGGGLTGRPAELLVIDDPIKDRKEADSETYRENVWEWWTRGRQRPPRPRRVRRGDPDPLARGRPRWPAHRRQRLGVAGAEHPRAGRPRPGQGQTDVLGREPGEFMTSARGRTPPSGSDASGPPGPAAWQALYQGRPSPAEGGILKARVVAALRHRAVDRTRRRRARIVPGVDGQDAELIQSWDMTFKDTKAPTTSSGRCGCAAAPNAYLLDQVRGRMVVRRDLQQFQRL